MKTEQKYACIGVKDEADEWVNKMLANGWRIKWRPTTGASEYCNFVVIVMEREVQEQETQKP